MGKVIELTEMRKIIADRMSTSWTGAPRAQMTLSVDVTNANAYMAKLNDGLEDKSKKVRMNNIIQKAIAEGISEYELINSSFTDEGIEVHDEVNVGLAVSVDNGLLVPNVKDVANKDIATLAQETNALVERTRANKITMDDITGGTITISNLGMMNIEVFSPIINLPEAAIIGVGKAMETPVVVDGEIVIKPMMTLTICGDHRIFDGAYMAGFLTKMKEFIEAL